MERHIENFEVQLKSNGKFFARLIFILGVSDEKPAAWIHAEEFTPLARAKKGSEAQSRFAEQETQRRLLGTAVSSVQQFIARAGIKDVYLTHISNSGDFRNMVEQLWREEHYVPKVFRLLTSLRSAFELNCLLGMPNPQPNDKIPIYLQGWEGGTTFPYEENMTEEEARLKETCVPFGGPGDRSPSLGRGLTNLDGSNPPDSAGNTPSGDRWETNTGATYSVSRVWLVTISLRMRTSAEWEPPIPIFSTPLCLNFNRCLIVNGVELKRRARPRPVSFRSKQIRGLPFLLTLMPSSETSLNFVFLYDPNNNTVRAKPPKFFKDTTADDQYVQSRQNTVQTIDEDLFRTILIYRTSVEGKISFEDFRSKVVDPWISALKEPRESLIDSDALIKHKNELNTLISLAEKKLTTEN